MGKIWGPVPPGPNIEPPLHTVNVNVVPKYNVSVREQLLLGP